MKFLSSIFQKAFGLIGMVLLLAACQSGTKSAEEATAAEEDQVLEWLSMTGNGEMPHVVLVSGDEEYRSEEAMPQLAKILSERHGFKCTVLFAQDPAEPGVVDANDGTNIPGLEHLASADLMILFTRFRALPDEQMKMIDDYLLSGKPVLGIRTSTHAFMFAKDEIQSSYKHYGNYYKGEMEAWKGGFGRLVLGENWVSHHGRHGHQSTRGIIPDAIANHPVLNGIASGEMWGPTDVYEVRLPMIGDAQPLVLGQTVDRVGEKDDSEPMLGMKPTDTALPEFATKKDKDGKEVKFNQNDPMMPIVWTKSYQIPDGKAGKALATTIGSSTDMLSEGVRRMMVNATFWLLGKDVPAKADVELVDTYNPSRFAFHDDEYWDNRDLTIESLR